ncbi:3'-5' exonuclease [Shewanella litoralis]|uniref:Ribonuclease D n=1 Tax=Shewanella litoralis TaxID=2282700 RepID=A0ABQ2RHE5_9GAMM|nr:3'-5' exonuclease [Shewanella litoralis]GGQ32385.1 ribonuclease D [Shewanella litoralis]
MRRPTKEQIRELPLYEGIALENIIVVTNTADAISAIAELKTHSCLGFDTESKPCFIKGEVSDGPHLIQIATQSKVFLFPTQFYEHFTDISDVLSDPMIKKVGFGLKEDRKILMRKFGIKLVNTEELSSKVMRFARVKQRVGARVAVAMFFNQRLSKSAQQSNWSIFPLHNHQKKYAANDAHTALLIELEIERQSQQ